MESFRRTLAFVSGVVMVFFGVTDDCPRVGAIAVGLLMMGLFTVPEVLGVIRAPPPGDPPEPPGGNQD